MRFKFALMIALLFSFPSLAWDHHQSLFSHLLQSKEMVTRNYLSMPILVPSEEEQRKVLEEISRELVVNVEKIPIQKPGKTTVREFILGDSVDEPDFGMDQDLPDSADSTNDRKWMGGKTGPTSQGFRHMIFPGIEWMHPLRTLQIPLGSIGKAPEQILKLQAISKKFFQQKKTYWALRTLLWELHLIQDLHQPFHVTQVPYYRMLPWKDAFRKFVPRSTQVIANFHYAYEGLVKESLQDGMLSRLNACFEVPARISFPAISRPVLDEVIRLTRAQAEKVGVPLVHLWNREMKDPVMNLPEGIGSIDYYSYLNANPDEDGQKEIIQNVDRILQSTCELMKKLSLITFSELDRAFQFQ